MATGTLPPPAPKRRQPPSRAQEDFVVDRIDRTGSEVRLVEVFAGLLTWLAATLGYLLTVVICDHWLVAGGLSAATRGLALLGLVIGSLWYGYRRIAPWMSRRINPVYAAQAIEQSRPGLKNSLINYLLLRGERSEMPAAVYQALEERAATDLTHVPAEGAVDRSHLVRVGYVLLAVVVVCCLYKLLSPKDPLASVGRMLAPWSGWTVPTRVGIAEIEPGATRAFHDDFVEVSAVVRGVRGGEPVTLYYSTTDGQTVDQPVPMELPAGSYRYRASLPAGTKGLQQSVDYYLVAGDARSRTFRVDVETAPALLVQQVDYDYPAYTNVPDRSVQKQGDLRAIQGTQVTLTAVANRDIAKADLDFDCDGTTDLRMKVQGRQAIASFAMQMGKDGRPEHASYQLRFIDADGKDNPQPIRHRIETLPDEAPLVEFLAPSGDETPLAANGVLLMAVRAVDPDFALRSVTLLAERKGEGLLNESLLSELHFGEFQGTYQLDATRLRLRPGDELLYWAEARDSRQPTANATLTSKYRLRIISDASPQEREAQRAAAERQEQQLERQQAEDEGLSQAARPSLEDGVGADGAANGGKPAAAQRDTQRPDQSPAGADEMQPEKPGDADNPSADSPRREPAPPRRDGQQGEADRNRDQNNAEQGDAGEQSSQRDGGQAAGQSDGQKSGGGQGEKSSQGGGAGQGDKPSAADDSSDGSSDSGDKSSGSTDKSSRRQPAGDEAKRDGGSGEKSDDKRQSGGDRAGQGTGDAPKRQPSGEQGAQRQQDRIDPEANPGEAFEKLLKHAREEQQQQEQQTGNEEKSSGKQQQGDQQPGDQQPRGDQRQRDQQEKSGQNGGAGQGEPPQTPQEKRSSGREQPATDKPPGDTSPEVDRGSKPQSGEPGEQESAGDQSEASGRNDSAGKPMPQDQSGQKSSGQGESGESGDAKGGQQGKQGQGSSDRRGDKTSPKQDGAGESGDQAESDEQGELNREAGKPGKSGGKQPPKPGQGKPPQGKPATDQSPQSPDDPPATERTEGDQGEGGATQPSQDPNDQRDAKQGRQKPQSGKQQGKQGGNPEQSQGESGAGQSERDASNAAGKEDPSRNRQKQQGSGSQSQGQDKSGEPASASADKNDSDSQGAEGGDRSGGGKKGGGQQSKQPGQGAPGSSTEADDGASASGSGGKGETGPNSGDGPEGGAGQGEKPGSGTAKPGGQQTSGGGQGSPSGSEGGAPGDGGSSASGQAGGGGGSQAGRSAPGEAPSGPSGAAGPGGGGDRPSGEAGTGTPTAQPQGDDPNLDYARRATDLVLQYLRDQQQGAAAKDELLDELNWTEADLEKFLARWERMKAEAQRPGEEGRQGRRKLDDALRGLGLVPETTRIEASRRQEKDPRNIGPTRRSEPPGEYAEQFRAYTRGAARQPAGKSGAKKP